MFAAGLCYLLRVGRQVDRTHLQNNYGSMAELLRSPDVVHSDLEGLKVPPQSLEAEQAVLGGLMLDNSTWDTVAGLVQETTDMRRL